MRTIPIGARLTLVAEAEPGSIFMGWSGACPKGGPRCEVLITRALVIEARFSPQLCLDDGWCWENPLPQGNAMRDLWVRRSGELWIVGDRGTILHGDGEDFRLEASGVSADLLAVWGDEVGDEVYAAGAGGVILRRQGGRWGAEASGTIRSLRSLFGAGGQVWAVGDAGTILRRTGGRWVDESVGGANLLGVWAGGDEAWAVGLGGVTWHRAAGAWTPATSGLATNLTGVFGVGGEVYTTTTSGVYVHRALGWRKANAGPALAGASRLWGSAPDDLWSAGSPLWHWNGTFWESFAESALAIGGSGPDLVYAVGFGGQILRWRGEGWERMGGTRLPTGVEDMIGLRGRPGSGLVWGGVGGNGSILDLSAPNLLQWSATGPLLRQLKMSQDFNGFWVDVSDVWSVSDNDFWLLSTGFPWRWTDGVGTDYGYEEDGYLNTLAAMWRSPSGSIFVLDPEQVLRWTEAEPRWNAMPAPPAPRRFEAIFGFADNDLWVAGGADSGLLHFDGAAWQRVSYPGFMMPGQNISFSAVFGTAPEDVWAIGSSISQGTSVCTGVHGRGRPLQWERFSCPGGPPLAIGGRDAEDVWLGSVGGLVSLRGGTTRQVPGVGLISSIFAGDEEMWASGGDLLLRRSLPRK